MAAPLADVPNDDTAAGPQLAVTRLKLQDFRSYGALALDVAPRSVVLVGPNGAGKTNLLEAVSLLSAGQGLRRAPFAELGRLSGTGGWSIHATLETPEGPREIGTGQAAGLVTQSDRIGRTVRLDGSTYKSSGILADVIEMVWVTPAMDGLFTGPAGERRRFLDRLILCFDPSYRTRVGHFEKAMASRNRLLADGVRDPAQLGGLERIMAETGIAIAAARSEAVAHLEATIDQRRLRAPDSPFPWARLVLDGDIERDLATRPAVDVEEAYVRTLRETRERDRAAGRTLDGPHRADFIVGHGPKDMPARLSSTGEQKALLVGLVLAHAELMRQRRDGTAPILLLDEIAAHFDPDRRAALFAELDRLGAQAWMTGTDASAFEPLLARGAIYRVEAGRVAKLDRI
ncbi:MAG: hypothetical protein RL291_781 [Pseudomonadota bacterium]